MKKLIIVAGLVILVGCGGGDGGDDTSDAADTSSTGDTTAAAAESPEPEAPLVGELDGHWNRTATDCVTLGDTGFTLVRTGEARSTDGLNSLIEVYIANADNPDEFSNSDDFRFNGDQDLVGDCLLPDIVADFDDCLVLCLGGVTADRARMDFVCDDGLTGFLCNLTYQK